MTNFFGKHSSSQEINGKFTSLQILGNLSSSTIPENNTLYVKGDAYIDGNFTSTGTINFSTIGLK
jgi:hypothetical protein